MFEHFAKMLIAAGAANADPVGPEGTPENVTPYESDIVKEWYDCTWTNPDETAYIQLSEDNKVSVAETYSPGTTDSGSTGSRYWTWADVTSGDLWLRYNKNGNLSAWVPINVL